MEKSLNFSEDLGWNWHKSWNIPNISIRIDVIFNFNKNNILIIKIF